MQSDETDRAVDGRHPSRFAAVVAAAISSPAPASHALPPARHAVLGATDDPFTAAGAAMPAELGGGGFRFFGSGFGHGIGMSQWGATAWLGWGGRTSAS